MRKWQPVYQWSTTKVLIVWGVFAALGIALLAIAGHRGHALTLNPANACAATLPAFLAAIIWPRLRRKPKEIQRPQKPPTG